MLRGCKVTALLNFDFKNYSMRDSESSNRNTTFADPLEHFVTAIKCDKEYLSKLINAPEMANFPNIISELRKLKLEK